MVSLIKSALQFKNSTNSNNLSVVLFSADFVDECKHVRSAMEEIGKLPDLSSVRLYDLGAEELSEIALLHKIEAVPTVLLFISGKQVDRIDGAKVAELSAKVKHHASVTAQPKSYKPLEDRLKSLINRHPVMVFIKGDRNTPRCGFSKTLIRILADANVEYDTFDILSDDEVRQGLKTYSDWPTYPQLYVKGELIGGLDIVKELVSSGELQSVLTSN